MNKVEKIFNIVFPPVCGICGKIGEFLCEDCYSKMQKYKIENQELQTNNDTFFTYKYDNLIRDLIIKYKFNDKSYLYKTFVISMIKNKNLCRFLKNYDIITAVPLHRKRKAERGYNQSELIAKELVKELAKSNKKEDKKTNTEELKFRNDLLIKIKNIKPQSKQNLKNRKINVKDVYEAKNKVEGKSIVIFDDIYTTGSTANECKRVLLGAGAKKVGILTLAKDYID